MFEKYFFKLFKYFYNNHNNIYNHNLIYYRSNKDNNSFKIFTDLYKFLLVFKENYSGYRKIKPSIIKLN